jgi:hypothetical protein
MKDNWKLFRFDLDGFWIWFNLFFIFYAILRHSCGIGCIKNNKPLLSAERQGALGVFREKNSLNPIGLGVLILGIFKN